MLGTAAIAARGTLAHSIQRDCSERLQSSFVLAGAKQDTARPTRHQRIYIALPPAPVPTPPWAVIDELAMSNSIPRHVGLSVVTPAGSGFFVVSLAPAPPPACTTCVRARARVWRGWLGLGSHLSPR